MIADRTNVYGESAGIRTQDPRLKRAMLYQLSYRLSKTERRHIVTRGAGRRGIIPLTRDGSLRRVMRFTDNPAPTVTVADARGGPP
jgi:hypothetical protein